MKSWSGLTQTCGKGSTVLVRVEMKSRSGLTGPSPLVHPLFIATWYYGMWLTCCFVASMLLFSPQTSAQTISKEQNRHYNHGLLRLVMPKIDEHGRIVLWWWAPSGKRLVFTPIQPHPGWIARLRHAIRDRVRYVAAGGHYFQLNSERGWVRLTLVKRVRRIFRGIRPVKFDGRMPIYQVTVLPRTPGDRLRVYKLWGRVSLHDQQYNNQMVCLFGDWFDFQDPGLGLVSQADGLKGSPLLAFPKQYRYPHKWHKIWQRRSVLVRYQDEIRILKKSKFPVKEVPIFSAKETQRAHQDCRHRMTPLENKISTPVDHLYDLELFQAAFFPFQIPLQLFALPGTFRRQLPQNYWSHGKVRPRDMY